MMTKSVQWGTAIYDSEGEVRLSGDAGGLGGFRLKSIHIVRDVSAADLPDPLCFGVNVANRLRPDSNVVMSPKLFMELLSARATAVALKQAVAASGYDIPGFANIAEASNEERRTAATPDHHTVAEYLNERPEIGDDCALCDSDDSGYASASLIEYENRMEPNPREVGQLQHINDLFAKGWQFDRNVSPGLILLKRLKG